MNNYTNHNCNQCNCQRANIIKIFLKDEYHYTKLFRCKHCDNQWHTDYPLSLTENKYQYIWSPIKKSIVPLHRWVWEYAHNIKLARYQHIHHINRNKGDNRLINLACMDSSDHSGEFHKLELTCPKCNHKWLPRAFQRKLCPKCKTILIKN